MSLSQHFDLSKMAQLDSAVVGFGKQLSQLGTADRKKIVDAQQARLKVFHGW